MAKKDPLSSILRTTALIVGLIIIAVLIYGIIKTLM